MERVHTGAVRSAGMMKTRSKPTDQPKMPYATKEMAENVFNNGVASSAGFMLMK